MNKEIKERWITALESGEYIHGVNALKKSSEGEIAYCCLGVLCDMYIKETGTASWHEPNSSGICEFLNSGQEQGIGNSAFLPDIVIGWSGMKDSRGVFTDDTDKRVSLVGVNDSSEDFGRVIECIEKYF